MFINNLNEYTHDIFLESHLHCTYGMYGSKWLIVRQTGRLGFILLSPFLFPIIYISQSLIFSLFLVFFTSLFFISFLPLSIIFIYLSLSLFSFIFHSIFLFIKNAALILVLLILVIVRRWWNENRKIWFNLLGHIFLIGSF